MIATKDYEFSLVVHFEAILFHPVMYVIQRFPQDTVWQNLFHWHLI